jgi:magnesium chelatase accessory protein
MQTALLAFARDGQWPPFATYTRRGWRNPKLASPDAIACGTLPHRCFGSAGTRIHKTGCTATRRPDAEGWHPDAIVGHSAGAAIALEMARAGHFDGPIIGINAALGNFTGFAGVVFPLMAKALAMTPMIAQIFTASTSRPKSVTRLIEGTGSKLSEADQRWYRALVSDRGHVNATLAMMAQWDLNPLLRDLPKHALPVLLITGDQDKAVPPTTSQNLVAKMPNAAHVSLPGLGHLAHEEDAKAILTPILQFLDTEIGQISDIN